LPIFSPARLRSQFDRIVVRYSRSVDSVEKIIAIAMMTRFSRFVFPPPFCLLGPAANRQRSNDNGQKFPLLVRTSRRVASRQESILDSRITREEDARMRKDARMEFRSKDRGMIPFRNDAQNDVKTVCTYLSLNESVARVR